MDEWRDRGDQMVSVYLYVEGGGDSKSLHDECRKGFRLFLERAGFRGRMPRIVSCGGREQAYEKYCMKVKDAEKYNDCIPVLLIDSERAIEPKYEAGNKTNWKPWEFLTVNEGKKWSCPPGTDNGRCHLMVQCMESWLLCDITNLKAFYGQGFSDSNLPEEGSSDIEKISKEKIYYYIENATKGSVKKGRYNKGTHSFKLLETTNYEKVAKGSKWASRFIADLRVITDMAIAADHKQSD